MYTRRLITAPVKMPVTKADVKEHLRIESTYTTDDDYLDALIASATAQAETRLARRLITQTWELVLEDWPGGDCIELPFGSLQSVTSVKYTDEDGNSQTFSDSNYGVKTVPTLGEVVLLDGASWPTETLYPVDPVIIRFICGYGDDPEDVPSNICHAIKLMVADGYEFRESGSVGVGSSPYVSSMADKSLLQPYRIWNVPT
jgi:uncharacterized phiE125 gp8 family phage protein